MTTWDMPPGCVPVEDLSSLVDAELGAADEARVRAHVAACSRCAELIGRLGGTAKVVASLPRESLAETRVREIAARAVREDASSPARGGSGSAGSRGGQGGRWMRWATAAAVLLGGVLIFQVTKEIPLAPPGSSPSPQARLEAKRPSAASARDESSARQESQEAPEGGLAFPVDEADAAAFREQAAPAAPAAAATLPAQVPAAAPAPAAVPPARERRADIQGTGRAMRDRDEPTPQAAAPRESAPSSLEDGATGAVLGGVVSGAGRDDWAPEPQRAEEAEVQVPARKADDLARRRATPAAPPSGERAKAAPAPSANIASATLGAESAPSARVGSRDSGKKLEEFVAKDATPLCGRVRTRPEDIPVEISSRTEPPFLLHEQRPTWPGTPPAEPLEIEAIVETDGTLSPCDLPAGLDAATERAVREAIAGWRWRPARFEDRPQAMRMRISVK